MTRHESEVNLSKERAAEITSLESEIEELKEKLFRHDQAIYQGLFPERRPTLEEKRQRSAIIRQLNRARRRLYRLRTGRLSAPKKRVSLTLSLEEYQQLQERAALEGLSLSAYIRRHLFPDL